MLPTKTRKAESMAQHHGLRSRLIAPFTGRNSENSLPGLEHKQHLRLLEVTSHDETSRLLQAKRKPRLSPQGPSVKRTAFSDVTNAIQRLQLPLSNNRNKLDKGKKVKTTSRKVTGKQPPVIQEETGEDENATLYMSALEDVSESNLQTQSQPEPIVLEALHTVKRSSSEPPTTSEPAEKKKDCVVAPIFITLEPVTVDLDVEQDTSLTELVTANSVVSPPDSFTTTAGTPAWHLSSPASPPPGVTNFDKETNGDTFAVPEYAPYIFCYLRSRESHYQVNANFLAKHELLTTDIRALCVDWMVEVQETLELNHETLYLGVKNMDLFLSNPKPSSPKHPTPDLPIRPTRLRLLACASLLLAAQYDERLPPPQEDWLQMCDQDYSVTELNTMQQQLFCALNFDLGAPLSYRFLRRFARACNVEIDLLTLARYILESSLLDSQFSSESDSKMAAAVLWLAMCMQAETQQPQSKESRCNLWTTSLQHYTGYKIEEIWSLATRLNAWISSLPTKYLRTVYSKYSHRVFRKVALVPALQNMC